MLDSIRTHRRWMMFFLMLLVFPTFVASGIYGYNRFVGDTGAIAKVDGQPIMPQALDEAQRRRLEQLQRMLGQNLDPSVFDTPQARAATLDNLMGERAVLAEADRVHLAVRPDRLRDVIRGIPAFQQDGKFDYERYKTLLASRGMTEASFEQDLAVDLKRQALLAGVSDSAFVPKSLTAWMGEQTDQSREIREQRFKPENFTAKVTVTDDAIKARYELDKKAYELPESVSAEYLVLSADALATSITVDNDKIATYYKENQARYGEPEQRRASHILIAVTDKATDAEKAKAQQVAADLLKRARANPNDFAKLARETSKDPGSADNGGDLGFFGPGMMVKPFEQAAYALKVGEISDLVKTDFGIHIIKLAEIKPASIKPFDQVRGEIEAEFRRNEAAKVFAEKANEFGNVVYEQSDNLQAAADRFKLKIQSIDKLSRQGVPPQAGGAQTFTPKVIDALFSVESIERKRNIAAVEVGANTLVSARVIEHTPAKLRPLDEVRAQIKSRIERDEAVRLAREAGEQRLAALKSGTATDVDAGADAARTISRDKAEGLGTEAINRIMRVPAASLPAFVGVSRDDGSYAVIRVLSAKTAEKTDPERLKAQSQSWSQQVGAGDDFAYVQALKVRHHAQVLKPEFGLNAKSDAKKDDTKADGAKGAPAK